MKGDDNPQFNNFDNSAQRSLISISFTQPFEASSLQYGIWSEMIMVTFIKRVHYEYKFSSMFIS